MKAISIKIEDELFDKIQKEMQGRYTTITEWIRAAIREKLGVRWKNESKWSKITGF